MSIAIIKFHFGYSYYCSIHIAKTLRVNNVYDVDLTLTFTYKYIYM